MLLAKELRERVNNLCRVTKQTQEQVANQAIGELLDRVDKDPVLKARIERAKELQAELDAL